MTTTGNYRKTALRRSLAWFTGVPIHASLTEILAKGGSGNVALTYAAGEGASVQPGNAALADSATAIAISGITDPSAVYV